MLYYTSEDEFIFIECNKIKGNNSDNKLFTVYTEFSGPFQESINKYFFQQSLHSYRQLSGRGPVASALDL